MTSATRASKKTSSTAPSSSSDAESKKQSSALTSTVPKTTACHAPGAAASTRRAVAVDNKPDLIVRLRRIEGQVRGVQQMVEDERYCPEVLAQIAAIEAALHGVSRALVKNHVRHCATHALRSDDEAAREAMVDELVGILGR